MQEKRLITKKELAQHNGIHSDSIWVAYKGHVFDVSSSRLFQKGYHYGHLAGADLTKEMEDAPHTARVFQGFPVIGKLTD